MKNCRNCNSKNKKPAPINWVKRRKRNKISRYAAPNSMYKRQRCQPPNISHKALTIFHSRIYGRLILYALKYAKRNATYQPIKHKCLRNKRFASSRH